MAFSTDKNRIQKIRTGALACLAFSTALAHAQPTDNDAVDAGSAESELSYKAYVHSSKRIKCLYGYIADKTGDHATAIAIFEDCIARWNDVYSMIWLAQIYESGVGIQQDFEKSTALLKRGACVDNESGYSSLARYHYGVALAEGRGTPKNRTEAEIWLKKAAGEGVKDAADYLERLSADAE